MSKGRESMFDSLKMEDVIDWLLDYAKDHHIVVRCYDDAPHNWPSTSAAPHRLILFNPNWEPINECVIQLAHEIGHVEAHHPGKNACNAPSVDETYESEANRIAINLILQYAVQNDLCFDNKQQLMDCFDIPAKMMAEYDHEIMQAVTEKACKYRYQNHRPAVGRIILNL